MVTQYFPPEMGAPQARLSELGERLASLGWEIDVLTAIPNYPGGHLFDGYPRARTTIEWLGALRIVRVPLIPSAVAGRMSSYLTYALAAIAIGARKVRHPQLIYAESPPLFVGAAARVLARRFGVPYVLNVSDLWVEAAIRMGALRSRHAVRLARALESWVYAGAAAVTGQSTEIVEDTRSRRPDVPVELITNGVDVTRFHPGDGARPQHAEDVSEPVFVYAGLLGRAQGLLELVDAVAQLDDAVPGKVLIAGDGPLRREIAERVERLATHRVQLLGAVERDQVPDLLARADVAIVTLGLELPGSVPSKIYEAMASGLPILLAATGEAARRVDDAQCGVVVAPGDREALKAAFEALARDELLRKRLGASGRRAAETHYDRDRIAGTLDRFLRSVLDRPPADA